MPYLSVDDHDFGHVLLIDCAEADWQSLPNRKFTLSFIDNFSFFWKFNLVTKSLPCIVCFDFFLVSKYKLSAVILLGVTMQVVI